MCLLKKTAKQSMPRYMEQGIASYHHKVGMAELRNVYEAGDTDDDVGRRIQ
eukprot:gene2286-2031_t